MNSVFVAAISVAVVVVLVCAYRPRSGSRRAERWAERARLPLEPAPLRRSIVRHFRNSGIAEAWGGLAAAGMLIALLWSPLVESGLYLIIVMLPAYLLTRILGLLIVSVHERLFNPAPDAPRIARLRTMRTSDYLGRGRRAVTWVMAGAAAATLVTLVLVGRRRELDPGAAGFAIAALVLALALCAALPSFERAILARSQPASDTIELAWDDALRSEALMNLRLSVGIACLLGLGLTSAALFSVGSPGFLPSQIIIWGQLALQLVFPTQGLPLRPALRPRRTAIA